MENRFYVGSRLRSLIATLAILATLVCLSSAIPALAGTIHVRADGLGQAPTIADAIFAAEDGDSIVLADGWYRGAKNRSLEFFGKAITLRSASGDPSVCVIDPEGLGRALYFKHGEGPGTVIEGIGIAGGQVTGGARGGGIACVNSSPTFRNCVITGCRSGSSGRGGGFSAVGGSPRIEGCTISGNFANRGGGIATDSSDLLLERTVVFGNCAGVGREVYSLEGSITLICSAVPPDGISGSWIDAGGNIGDDPLFCGERPCADAPFANGNYHLLPGSPCLPEGNDCGVRLGALGEGCGTPDYGACCLATGACVEATPSACAASGGDYWGDGSDCDPSPCHDPGACCTALGGCHVASYVECADDDGYWRGPGTACLPNPCAPPIEACLFLDFDMDDDPWTIESVARGSIGEYRWVFQCPPVSPAGEWFELLLDGRCIYFNLEDPGFDPTYVAEAIYSPPTGGGAPYYCRFADDAPFVPGERYFIGRGTVEANCESEHGCIPPDVYFEATFYPQFETTCDPVPFRVTFDCDPPYGACCLPNGGCEVWTESECQDLDGEYQGWDTTCDPWPCPDVGACCFDDGTCTAITEFACSELAGGFYGEGVSCDPNPCPLGAACCLADGTCIFLIESACIEQDGDWAGGMSCDPTPCDPGGVCCLGDGRCTIVTEAICLADAGTWNGSLKVCTPYPCPPVRVEADGTGMVATIQDAIDVVTTGGVVELGSGTYLGPRNRDLLVVGKAVTIRSEAGVADSVIIDCELQSRGITFASSGSLESALEYVTIVRGKHSHSGGVSIVGSPTIRGCRILGCVVSLEGAAIGATQGNPVLIDCLITGNRSAQWAGGIRLEDSAEIIGCTISGNYARSGGGGIVLKDGPGNVHLERTVVWGNCADTGFADIAIGGEGVRFESVCSIIDPLGVDPTRFAGDLIFDDPVFCAPLCDPEATTDLLAEVAANSPCLPGGNSCGVRIGAADQGCEEIALGACCFEDTSCHVRTAASCAERNGGWVPDETCDPGPCAPVVCCLADFSCVLLSQAYCIDLGGDPRPEFLTCDPSPCDVAIVRPDRSGAFPSIQAAVNAVQSGQTILLTDGVFSGIGNRYVTTLGKAITIRSESGDPASCVIDCRIDSVTAAWAFSVTNNEGPGTRFEGITMRYGAGALGGAMRVIGASPTIVNCVFESSTSPSGGGLYLDSSAATVRDCRFNACAAGQGGAVYAVTSAPTFEGCVFDGNQATTRGGAVALSGNLEGGETTITTCTFHESASPEGGHLSLAAGATAALSRSILAFGFGGAAVACTASETIAVDCCDVFGNEGGDWVGCLAGLEGGDANFSADPLFCDRAEGDLSLDLDSPCTEENSPCGLEVGALPPTCTDVTSVDDVALPIRLLLAPPRPNPATGSCELRFGLPAPAPVELRITDVAGRLVAVPLRAEVSAGHHTVTWDGRNLRGDVAPSGVYHVQLHAMGTRLGTRVVWLR